MADLKKESASLERAARGLGRTPHHISKPLHDFAQASHDLSALGALGSLLRATEDVRHGMHTISKLASVLEEEWGAEAKLVGEVSDAFDVLDALLAAGAHGKKRG